MTYKQQLSILINSIYNLIKQLNEDVKPDSNILDIIEHNRKRTILLINIQNKMIQIEILLKQVKNDFEYQFFLLKDRYNDHLSMGFWDYCYHLCPQ